ILDRNTFGLEIFEEDEVGGLRINVIAAHEIKLLLTLSQQIVDGGRCLLVHGFRGVEDVFRQFFAFVLDWIKQHTVILLENRKHRLTAKGGPTAENYGDLILLQQLLGFFREQWPVGSAIYHDGFNLFSKTPAIFIDFIEGEQQRIAQRGFA